MTAEPPEEVKVVIRAWVKRQREKYGENWKEIVAKEMAEKTVKDLAPVFKALKDLKNDPRN